MKALPATTLSRHLLREAEKFLFYPNREHRSRVYLEAQKTIDGILRQLVEWRKTFALRPKQGSDDLLNTPVLLDELYCRDLLRAVPEIVERTRNLSQLHLSQVGDAESIVYLREAANCYILGLPQAAIALARAAVETRLRAASSKVFGKSAVQALDLIQIINDIAVRGQLLNREGQALAHKVREAANQVLHGRPADPATALDVFEAARAVIMQLRGQ